MNKLYVMVGIPGSGKSTYANELVKKGCVVHSSDAIRLEKTDDKFSYTNDKKVFSEMRCRIVSDLKAGKDVVCDATNVTLSKRASLLNALIENKIDCEKIAIVVNKDVKLCIAQNAQREESKRVPNIAIYTLNSKFIYPTLEEGFTEIIEI